MSKRIPGKSIPVYLAIVVFLVAIIAARAQTPAVPVAQVAAKLSKFDVLAARTGSLFRREYFPILSARSDSIHASVVRLEDLVTHDVVLSLQVELPDNHGIVCASAEEMPTLKDSVAYIMENVGKLDASQNAVDVEYRTIATGSFGYCVHRKNTDGEEMPPTAYIELPVNPALPQIGGLEKLSPQLLQKMIAEAQAIMDKLNAGN